MGKMMGDDDARPAAREHAAPPDPLPPDPLPLTRAALEAEWIRLTRAVLPGLAAARGWPVRADHCFQRILLDDAFGGVWYDHVPRRPAYRHLPDDRLAHAVATARAAAAGQADLRAMNDRSLAWRGKRRG